MQMRATFDNQMKAALSLNVKNWKGFIYCCKFQNKLKMLLADISFDLAFYLFAYFFDEHLFTTFIYIY